MAKVNTNPKLIKRVLERGVDSIYPSRKHLEKRLLSGKLRIKLGIDPTGEKIHIGRAVALRKLRDFQDTGHTIVLIIGDYTAQIGDPSDKLEKRPFLTQEQIKKNMKNYLAQIGSILNIKKVEIHYNSEWLKKFNLRDMSELAEQFTIQQMMQRRNFKDRLKDDQNISMRELFYPLMQGYDSVAIKADVELGGTDQLFNLMAGRKIQERYKQKPQDVMTTKMLIGLDGRKMSTSWGNVINIIDKPNDMFGKVMSMHDEHIVEYLELVTDMPMADIKDRAARMKSGKLNPRDAKAELARLVVEQFHGVAPSVAAEEEFEAVYVKGEEPKETLQIEVSEKICIADVLVNTKLVTSKSEARRLVEQGGVKHNRKKIEDSKKEIDFKSGDTIQVGKRKFVRIK